MKSLPRLVKDPQRISEKTEASESNPIVWMLLVPAWIYIFIALFRFGPIDQFFAFPFYEGAGKWYGESNVLLFRTILHKGGKIFPVIAGVGSLVLLLCSYLSLGKTLKPYRKQFTYVIVAIVTCALSVVGAKALSSSPCPWSLEIFGGNPEGAGRCFPAGQASSGFALFALFFAFLSLKFSKSPLGSAGRSLACGLILGGVVVLGLILGIGRQAQGAHFISHTVATMFFDWSICAFLYFLFFQPRVFIKKPTVVLSAGSFALAAAVYLAFFLNLPFFAKVFSALHFSFQDLTLIFALAVVLLCIMFIGVRILYFRWIMKAGILLFSLLASGALYFNYEFGTIINTEMMNNAFATDTAEASELISFSSVAEITFLTLPGLFACLFIKVKRQSWLNWLGQISLALIVGLMMLYANFQGISSLIRTEPVTRNLIAPANVLSSTYKALVKESSPSAPRVREVIDPQPSLGETHNSKKGMLFVVVVGETVRLANWGLAGYERQTTPELKARNVYAFKKTISCGTSTDISLPCMFSRVGRRNYDRDRILREESLLPVLKRAGMNVYWVDNQSGSKGVSDGITELPIDKKSVASLCRSGRCFDEALLAGLDISKILKPGEDTVIFMHQLGNHGPAYSKRYPKTFEKYTPVCEDEQLQKCSRQSIINAYDNSVLYTDHFLAGVIDWLKGMKGMDTGLLYVSDHGENLGENNLYLHGAPEFMAPSVQKEVPMILWLSNSLEERLKLDTTCFRKVLDKEASHDNLYSSLLGLLDVKSTTYDKSLDFTSQCRKED
ncbi:phosphoethanolamine--lipid A transferase [Turicimonas muris]|uniref:phosphoethanolamine--lipid A transferase n=1 Tax=Turicimonas muris TaxID=1796652 RepID=UPI0026E10952|nr:phosphoethanolamine--lipid A transferase [Turicimonas muris]